MADKKSIGALWIKQSTKGQYLSGYIEVAGVKQEVVCFINGHKKEAKHPDYQVLPSEKRNTNTYEPRTNTPADIQPDATIDPSDYPAF